MTQSDFGDIGKRLKSLSDFGDPLDRLSAIVDFEQFRPILEEGFAFRSGRGWGGRPPYDAILIFKILILQNLYNLSDDQTEYQIKDRLSFMRFLGLSLADRVPDSKTIWMYRERLKKKKLIETLFASFDRHLKGNGYLAMSGQLVDASIVQAPRQRMTKDEKEQVKAGDIPQKWQDHPAKLAQKDMEARWFVKHKKSPTDKRQSVDIAIPMFGYKTHISTDRRHGFVRKCAVTPANVYDGHVLEPLLDPENTASGVWGDKAYKSQENERLLEKRGLRSEIHRKKPKGKPMPERTRRANAKKSRVRSPIEHVFGHQKGPMALFIRTIGLARAKVKINLVNLVYNMKRLVFWEQKRALTG